MKQQEQLLLLSILLDVLTTEQLSILARTIHILDVRPFCLGYLNVNRDDLLVHMSTRRKCKYDMAESLLQTWWNINAESVNLQSLYDIVCQTLPLGFFEVNILETLDENSKYYLIKSIGMIIYDLFNSCMWLTIGDKKIKCYFTYSGIKLTRRLASSTSSVK